MYCQDLTTILPLGSPARARTGVRHRQLPGLEGIDVDFRDRGEPGREELERFVRASFAAAYGARLRHFMPRLMSLRDRDGELLAVCGLRDAAHARMFLETYLDHPAQRILGTVLGRCVDRASLMEVGNLAVVRPGLARYLIAALTEHLWRSGRDWAVFSAVPALRNGFTRLGIRLVTLGPADKLRLPKDEWADWGEYYESKPMVVAAGVHQARAAIEARGLPAFAS